MLPSAVILCDTWILDDWFDGGLGVFPLSEAFQSLAALFVCWFNSPEFGVGVDSDFILRSKSYDELLKIFIVMLFKIICERQN